MTATLPENTSAQVDLPSALRDAIQRASTGDKAALSELLHYAEMAAAGLEHFLSAGYAPPNPLSAPSVEFETTSTDGTAVAVATPATVNPDGSIDVTLPQELDPNAGVIETDDGEMLLDLFGDTPDDKVVPATISTPDPVPALKPQPVGTQRPQPTRTLSTTAASDLGRPGWWVAPLNNTNAQAHAMFDKVLKHGGQQHTVFWLVWDHRVNGMTDEEIEQATGRTHQSISAARRGLVIKGYLKATDRTRMTKSHNPATVWTVTDEAHQRVQAGLERRD